MSRVKAQVARKRAQARKKRRDRLLTFKMEQWQALEDAKEGKIIRDRQRLDRERTRLPFSFTRFLADARAAKRPQVPLESEAEFERRLLEDRSNYLVRPPRAVRRVYHARVRPNLRYETRLEREVLAPWLHELRRKSRVAHLVGRRLEAEQRSNWEVEQRSKRQALMAVKAEEWRRRMEHWDKALGDWHAAHARERFLKGEFMKQRRQVTADSRKEFLSALGDDLDKWVESPQECRFLRFRFVTTDAGLPAFPRTKAAY